MRGIEVSNQFGKGFLWNARDMSGKIYARCCACMSVYSEFLTWANAHAHRFTRNPADANSIVVLGCQVTDLAVLNDLKHLRELMSKYAPYAVFYVGGCLARRFDIPLPDGVRRLDNTYSDETEIIYKELIDFAKPFWVKDFEEDKVAHSLRDGHLFRNYYPIRIGVGCKKKCTYCTINTTRGDCREMDFEKQKQLALKYAPVVLIADNPTKEQICQWCEFAISNDIELAFRNVEPDTAMQVLKGTDYIEALMSLGLLDTFHVPIQSNNLDVLKDMGRAGDKTLEYIEQAARLRRLGVTTATNIIIDYKNFPNPSMEDLKKAFQYISWNPYWDGHWDEGMAELRWRKYFG